MLRAVLCSAYCRHSVCPDACRMLLVACMLVQGTKPMLTSTSIDSGCHMLYYSGSTATFYMHSDGQQLSHSQAT
jgi:hypothetical protein